MALIKIIMKRTEVQTKLNLRWEDYRLPQQVLLIFQLANKQWGYSNSETTVNFPMTFGSVLIILGTKRAIQYEYTVAATDITSTKFYLSTRNNSGSSRVIACNWIALGS